MTKHDKYNHSEKGRERMRRYDRSEKGRARAARHRRSPAGLRRQNKYNASAKGRARDQRSEARKIRIGKRYLGYADTPERAAAINAHIRRRLHEFVSGFPTGTQAEGAQTRAVPAEANPGTDRLGGRHPAP